MSRIPSVESVMTPLPICIDIDATVKAAEDMMMDHEFRHLPVTEGGELVGVLSDRDIAFVANDEKGVADQLRVREICTLDLYAAAPDEPLDVVLTEMAQRRIGSVVVSQDGKAVGLFTATDACRCFAEHLREA